MNDCKFRLIRNDKCETYSCDEVREKRNEWLSKFREKNGTDFVEVIGGKDRMYENYRKSIDSFLNKCKCQEPKEKILPVCSNCTKEEHERYFCQCEGRNIRLAKQLREEGKSPWQKLGNVEKYDPNQTCNFCNNPESILTEDTCCTGCSKLSR